jgi:DnaJ-class molecular chaperone
MSDARERHNQGQGNRPGDEAPPGTPGTGENLCPDCKGNGRIGDQKCETCNGTGRITEGVGGA